MSFIEELAWSLAFLGILMLAHSAISIWGWL